MSTLARAYDCWQGMSVTSGSSRLAATCSKGNGEECVREGGRRVEGRKRGREEIVEAE